MSLLPARIHVLESPSPDDFLHGIQEGRALYETLRIGAVDVRVHTVITKDAFTACVKEITEETATADHQPILHISSHGDQDCIQFSDGTQLGWKDLGDILHPLNTALNGVLLICMSTCFGGSGFQMTHRLFAKAFHTLIGSSGKVRWNDALIGYAAFYHHLICKQIDIPTALTAMHAAAGLPANTFQSFSGAAIHEDFVKSFIDQIVKHLQPKPYAKPV